MDNLTGQSLKGYELLDRIGSGGFGAVYRAYQSTIGREVAVKVILPHFADHPGFIRRFEAEAQLIARLEHLHIVPLYDYWREPGGAYLAMRWMRGGNLQDALREGPFNLEPAAEVLDQVAAALAAAHAAEVVHRDLKPSNILLDEEGNAYLADFGIALDMRLDRGNGDEGQETIGSPAHLAPEQIQGEGATPQSDIYSLGITLYELLSGTHPFADVNTVELLYRQLNEPLPPLTTLPDEVQADVNAVVQRATAKDPRKRYDDALALAAAFRKAARLRERAADELVELLTPREQEVLALISDGLTNRQIAQQLYVEHSTVKWYIRQIYGKLGVRSRRQAIARAREMEAAASAPASAPAAPTTKAPHRDPSQLPPLNPYKGIRPFDAADRDDFFGREALVERLLARLALPDLALPEARRGSEAAPGSGRFLAVVGPSGSGKSSLVRAGLIPALWDGRLPGSERWFVVEFTPGARPLDELEVGLIRVAAEQAGNLHEQLLRDKNGLLRAAQLILPRDDSELVLVVDQFEELFSLVEDEAERAFFLDLLTTAVCDLRSRVRVVLTLRADYYDRPLQYATFGDLVRRHMETVLPLKAQELEQAIVRPAEAVGVAYEAGLAVAIMDDVLYQPGALPLLQYALTELFEGRKDLTLTHAAYESIGGATGALSKRAEELYLEQDETGRELIRQLFLRLVSAGQEDDALPDRRRRVPLKELLALDQDEDRVDELIDIFAAYRLLTLDHDPASRRPTVEVAHEALLREWDRLRGWLDESRADLRQRRQLGRAAGEWRQAGEDPSFLLRGARLAQFESWSKTTDLAMTETERDYLQAGAELRDAQAAAEAARQARETQLERRARRVLGALAIVFLLAATVSGWLALRANRNFARSESQRLAAEANIVLEREGSPELAALLALRGLDSHYTLQADLALQRTAAAPMPVAVIKAPGGAFWPVISPDSRFLRFIRNDPEGSVMRTVELWDLQAMKRLWQTQDYIVPGYPSDKRNVTADAAAIVAVSLDDSELHLLDAKSGERTLTLQGNASPVVTMQISAEGNVLVAGTRGGEVHVWRMESGEEMGRFSVGDGDYAREPGRELVVGVSRDGRLVAATAGGQTRVWDIESGVEVYRFEHEHFGWWNPPQFLNDGNLLVATTLPSLSLWDLRTGQEIDHGVPPGQEGILSPDGRLYAAGWAGESGREVILWEVGTGRELRRLTGHTDGARPVAFVNDGRQLVTWGFEGTARVWDVASGKELFVLAGHTDAIDDATVSPDGRYLVTTGQDDYVRVWDLSEPLRAANRLHGVRHVLQFSPDGRMALTTDPETGNALLVEADSFEVLHQLEFTPNVLVDGTRARPPFSSDGEMVLGVKDETTIVVYDVASGEHIAEHTNPDGVYKHAAFVPDSKQIFAGGDRGAYLLDAISGEQLHVFEVRDTFITEQLRGLVGVSGDGRYGALAVGGTEQGLTGNAVYLWNLETRDLLYQSGVHASDITVDFAFSDDSRMFAFGGTGNVVYVRDLDSGEEVMQLSHLDSIHNLDFSSDAGQIVTSTGGDGVSLWDLNSGEIVRRFFAGDGQGGSVRFTENDRFIMYSYLEDGSILRHPINVQALIESMCARLQRDLTADERQTFGLDNAPTCS